MLLNILRSVIGFFFEIFFGCRHDHLTRPFTLERNSYKVCLDCGRKLWYSTETMRLLRGRQARQMEARHREAQAVAEVKVVPAISGPQLVPVRSGKTNVA